MNDNDGGWGVNLCGANKLNWKYRFFEKYKCSGCLRRIKGNTSFQQKQDNKQFLFYKNSSTNVG